MRRFDSTFTVAGAASPTAPARWVGWERLDKLGATWQRRCTGATWDETWWRLLWVTPPPGACERIVMEEGRHPLLFHEAS
jgi:hypothetical protein